MIKAVALSLNLTDRQISNFEGKVELIPGHECHEWTAGRAGNGYGAFDVDGRVVLAHRVAYAHYVGPVPSDTVVRHSCDNILCVRPSHLSLGTQAENIQDKVDQDRQAWGEEHGMSKLTDAEVLTIRDIYSNSPATQVQLARCFNVSQSLISAIVNRKHWTHLP